MFRTLSRILRNNDFIRILAICQICILIFTVPAFASGGNAPTQDVEGYLRTTNNFTVWTDYTQNFNIYYGDQDIGFSDALLSSIAQTLKYHGQGTSYHIITGSSSNGASPTYYISGFLADVTWNQWQLNQQLKASTTDLSSDIANHTTQMNNALYDYQHLGQSAYSVGTTSKNTAVNTSNIYNELHNINWINTNIVSTVSLSTSFNQNNPIYPNTSNNLSPGTYYLRLPNFPYDTSNYDTNLFRFDIPFRTQWTSLFNKNWITDISVLVDNANTVYQGDYYWDIDVMKNGQYYLRFYFLDFIPYHNNTLVIKFTTTDTWLYTSDDTKYVWYLPSSSPDYLAFNDYVNLKRLQAKDFTASISGDVQMDTTNLENKIDDVISAIDDVSLVNNNVKLNLNINNNTGSDGSNIIGRLQNFFNNGTSISDFFDNVDDAESGWFTQTNSDLINTLSGGYVNLYE